MLSSLIGLALFLCTTNAVNVIGPAGNLAIVNKNIAPDGFERAYVFPYSSVNHGVNDVCI